MDDIERMIWFAAGLITAGGLMLVCAGAASLL